LKQRLELEIIGCFDKNITSVFSINQIASLLKRKYPYINRKVSMLLDEGILTKRVFGSAYMCSLNLENERTVLLLSQREIERKNALLREQKNLREILTRISGMKKKVTLHSVLLSKGNLVCVVEDEQCASQVKALLKGTQDSILVLDKKNFQEKLLSTNIAFDHTILYGYEKYYEMLGEMQNELLLKYSPLFATK
jgi:hypothetical protein